MLSGSHKPVTARGVRHRFLDGSDGSYGADGKVALDGVDLDVEPGELLAVVGANGAGKSTLLRVFAGSLVPDAGEVRVFGLDPARSDPVTRRRVAWLSQELALDPEMRGGDTLRFFAALHGLARSVAQGRMEELTRAFELEEHLPRRVGAYSGGLRRRLHVALALLGAPALLLLDEATAGLDPRMRSVLAERIDSEVRAGRSAVVVTHDLAELRSRAHRIAVLSRGTLAVLGPAQEVVESEAFRALSEAKAATGAAPVHPDPGLGRRRRERSGA